jgi:hypothetical protein
MVKQSMVTPKFHNNVRFHRSISPNFLKASITGKVQTHEERMSMNQINSNVRLDDQHKLSTFGVSKHSD